MLAAAADGRLGSPRSDIARFLSLLQHAFVQALRRRALGGPVLGDSAALADYLHARLAHRRSERFLVLFLDIRNRLLAEEEIGAGAAAGVLLHPRQILARALETGASGLILVHNHPSGNATPSEADIRTTRRIAEAAGALDIEVLDHVIVAAGGWTSFAAQGLIGGTGGS